MNLKGADILQVELEVLGRLATVTARQSGYSLNVEVWWAGHLIEKSSSTEGDHFWKQFRGLTGAALGQKEKAVAHKLVVAALEGAAQMVVAANLP